MLVEKYNNFKNISRTFVMACFGPRTNGLTIFGPGQDGPIYKRQIRAKMGRRVFTGPRKTGPGQNRPGCGPTQA